MENRAWQVMETSQGRAGHSRQFKAWQGKTGQGKAWRGRAGQVVQVVAKQGRAEYAGQGKTSEGKARQGYVRQGKEKQGKAR
jgi:hypothetical protein